MNRITKRFIEEFLYPIDPQKNETKRARFYRVKTDKESIVNLVRFINYYTEEAIDEVEIVKLVGYKPKE